MRTFYKTFIFIILLSVAITAQFYFDSAKAKQNKPSPLVLNSKIVETFDLGLHNAASDLYWLSAIQYFGDWQTDKYQKLDNFIETATNLDPLFSYPYAFATLSLPSVDMTDKAIEIAQKGIKEATPDWRIPFYLAAIYYTEKNDIPNAAKYFDLAANTKGAPDSLRNISASFSVRPDLRENIKNIWITMYENSNDETVKDRAKSYIYHYEILDLLEKAATIYKQKNGVFPTTSEELVQKNILKAIPTDPFGFQYEFDADGRAQIKQ